jgi:hypothetical protein
MAEQIILAYNPSDFFYVKAAADERMPDSVQCQSLTTTVTDISCNNTNFASNIQQCFEKELCINKSQADWIRTYQNVNSGSKRTYTDSLELYKDSYLTTINLGIGIIILIGAIVGNRYI